MPQDSKHQQIAAFVVAALKTITVDAGYRYTLEQVVPLIEPTLDNFVEARDLNLRAFAMVFPGEDEPVQERSTERVTKEMLLGVVLARRADADGRNTDSPFAHLHSPRGVNTPTSWEVKNGLLKDTKDRLSLDLTLGGLAIELLFPDLEGRQYYVDDWDAVYLPLTVVYSHPRLAS